LTKRRRIQDFCWEFFSLVLSHFIFFLRGYIKKWENTTAARRNARSLVITRRNVVKRAATAIITTNIARHVVTPTTTKVTIAVVDMVEVVIHAVDVTTDVVDVETTTKSIKDFCFDSKQKLVFCCLLFQRHQSKNRLDQIIFLIRLEAKISFCCLPFQRH
jgi:hypothetical protein